MVGTDRSGRTFEEYRQLYWDGQKRIAELEQENQQLKDALVKANNNQMAAAQCASDFKYGYEKRGKETAALEAELTQERKDLHEAWDLYQAAKAKLDAVQATIKRVEGLPPDLTRSEQGGFGEPLIVEYVKRVNIREALAKLDAY